jgi:hypothetical protein
MSASRVIVLAVAVSAALALSACGSSSSSSHPSRFVARVDNPWYPLAPGTVLHYRGEKEGVPMIDVVKVAHATKQIAGARATVVTDRVYVHGRLSEDTVDWFAQDRRGNVWYLGEDTKELDAHGRVTSREGSWQAGVHGAQPGIIMPANPRVGQSFRMEFESGHAEDWARIASVSSRRLRTEEWTPLEPGGLDNKVYVRGVGSVRERTVRGGNETLELLSVSRG